MCVYVRIRVCVRLVRVHECVCVCLACACVCVRLRVRQCVCAYFTTLLTRLFIGSLLSVTLFQCGDKLHLSVLREKKLTEVVLALRPQFDLVPLAQHDILPPYFVRKCYSININIRSH